MNEWAKLAMEEDEDDVGWYYLSSNGEIWTELPWQLSYSYGRALQADALLAWARKGPEASQIAFAHRCQMNSLARSGDWIRADDYNARWGTPDEVEARLLELAEGEDPIWEGHRN